LRGRGHDMPAILMTGLGDPETRARAERAGAAAFFEKPIDPSILFSTLTRLLSDRRV
jgi:FixJ family two-component response regulator